MDTEDGSFDDNPPGLLERNTEKTMPVLLEDNPPQGTYMYSAFKIVITNNMHYVSLLLLAQIVDTNMC